MSAIHKFKCWPFSILSCFRKLTLKFYPFKQITRDTTSVLGRGQLYWEYINFTPAPSSIMVLGTGNLSWPANTVPALNSSVSSYSVLSWGEHFLPAQVTQPQVRDGLTFSASLQWMHWPGPVSPPEQRVSTSLNLKPSYESFVLESHVLMVPRDEIRLPSEARSLSLIQL